MNTVLGNLMELKRQGRKLVGCFPLYPPVELLHSFGLTPIVLWDLNQKDPLPIPYPGTGTCLFSRRCMDFIKSDLVHLFDALFMYSSCYTLRNMPELLRMRLQEKGIRMPVLRLRTRRHEHEDSRVHVHGYLKGSLRNLIKDLEKLTGRPFSPDDFQASGNLYRRKRSLCSELEVLSREGSIPFSIRTNIIRLAHFMPVEAHIDLLEEKIYRSTHHSAAQPSSGKVMLSSILPPPGYLVRQLESSGLRVISQNAGTFRTRDRLFSKSSQDPAEYYRFSSFTHYPCATMLTSGSRKVSQIVRSIRNNDAKGYIHVSDRYCRHDHLEILRMAGILRNQGVVTLSLEMGSEGVSNPIVLKNRIQAFAEVVKN